MAHVEAVVNRGLAAIQATIQNLYSTVCDAVLQEGLQHNVDRTLFSMPLVLPPNWDYFRRELAGAKLEGAYNRYKAWHDNQTSCTSEHLGDTDYRPDDADYSPDSDV